jgi:hypothetical protein
LYACDGAPNRFAPHPGMPHDENHSHMRHSWLRTHTSDAVVARYYQELLNFCWRNREAAADLNEQHYGAYASTRREFNPQLHLLLGGQPLKPMVGDTYEAGVTERAVRRPPERDAGSLRPPSARHGHRRGRQRRSHGGIIATPHSCTSHNSAL